VCVCVFVCVCVCVCVCVSCYIYGICHRQGIPVAAAGHIVIVDMRRVSKAGKVRRQRGAPLHQRQKDLQRCQDMSGMPACERSLAVHGPPTGTRSRASPPCARARVLREWWQVSGSRSGAKGDTARGLCVGCSSDMMLIST
jgi:hypothetical protein